MRYDYDQETLVVDAWVDNCGVTETDARTVYRILDRCTGDIVADAHSRIAAASIVDALNASASAAAR